MASERDDRSEDLKDSEIEDWYRHADGCQDGQTAGLGVQARDRKIRRLIEEVRRLRRDGAEGPDLRCSAANTPRR